MTYLLVFLWSIPSGALWFINAEAMVVYQVSSDPTLAPWLVALAATAGQFIGYAALYHFAASFLQRFRFVRRAAAKVRIETPGPGTWLMFFTGGLVGLPPLLALFTVYGSARVGPIGVLVACAAPARLAWYLGWAYAPDFIRDTFIWT